MAINIVCGLTGSGKTYFITRYAIELLKKHKKGFGLFANYTLNKEAFPVQPSYFSDPREFLTMEKSLVLIDDGAIYFGSRQWNRLPWQVQHKVINNRKDGLQVYITTQFFDSLDRTFRDNCHKYYECEKVFGSDEYAEKPWGLIRVKQYRPRDHDKIRRKAISTRYFWISKRFTDLYDTFEKIEPMPFTKKEALGHIKEIKEKTKEKEILTEKRRGRPRKIPAM